MVTTLICPMGDGTVTMEARAGMAKRTTMPAPRSGGTPANARPEERDPVSRERDADEMALDRPGAEPVPSRGGGRAGGAAPATGPGSFGQTLVELRTARGWAQTVLARRSGLDNSSISRFENGQRMPERETVIAVSDAMALPVVERERLLAAAGFRSEAWDDPLIAELVEILADPSVPSAIAVDVQTLVRVAVEHGRRGRGR